MIRQAATLPDQLDSNGARGSRSPRPARVSTRHERPLRVLHCLDGFGVGGTELNAIRTLERLDRERYEVALASHALDGPLRSRFKAAAVPVHSFPISNLYGPGAMRQAIRLLALLRRWRPDVVHCHDCYTNITAAHAARLAGVPLVVASRRWWDALPRRIYQVGNRWVYRHVAHRVLANSPSVGRLVRDAEGVPERKLVVIPNFVDDDAFALPAEAERRVLRRALGVPEEAIVVGCVARLRPEKDHGTLLHALRRLAERYPMIHLVLVGDGPEEPALRRTAAELGIDGRVSFAGFRPNRPNPHALFDVSVLCSLHEGFPNSIIEAMAAARPVVATRVGGVPDAVDDGVTGILVPPSDAETLAAALERLVADGGLRRAYGAAGVARARAHYRADEVLTRLDALYDGARSPER